MEYAVGPSLDRDSLRICPLGANSQDLTRHLYDCVKPRKSSLDHNTAVSDFNSILSSFCHVPHRRRLFAAVC